MENEYPALTLVNKILGKSGFVYISTLYPSPLTCLMFFFGSPFDHEFLGIQFHADRQDPKCLHCVVAVAQI